MISKEKITIWIPVYNQSMYTSQIIDNIQEKICLDHMYDYDILIIDDGSTDDTTNVVSRKMEKYNNITYIKRENKGVNATRNELCKKATGNYVCIINNDILFERDSLKELANVLKNYEQVYMTVPYFRNPWSGLRKYEEHGNGHCWMVRKKDWKKIWPIDERLRIRYGDNWLYCKIRQDLWKTVFWVPSAEVFHFEGKTTFGMQNKDSWMRSKILEENHRYFTVPTVLEINK